MAQSLCNTYTVNNQILEDYEENWETKKPYIQSNYEPIQHLKAKAAKGKFYNTNAITDSPGLTDSKDGQQTNPFIVALVDSLLKEARAACDLLQQQGQWQEQNTTGRIRRNRCKGGRSKASGLLEIFDKSYSTSRRLSRRAIQEKRDMEVAKEISLLMSDLTLRS